MNLIIHLMVVMLVHIFYLLVRASLASFIMDVGFFAMAVGFFAMAVYGFPGLLAYLQWILHQPVFFNRLTKKAFGIE